MNPSPTPWEVDFRKDEHGDKIPVLLDANGKIVADAFNSDVAYIYDESDEDGRNSWDEQGRVNFELIVKAIDALARIEEAEAENLHLQTLNKETNES